MRHHACRWSGNDRSRNARFAGKADHEAHISGANVRQTAEFLWVGEWLLAYEGVYVLNRKHPGILVACDMQALNDYFDEDMSELD